MVGLDDVAAKKAELDRWRPLPAALVANLDAWYQVELTFSSNAIEGNTLTRQETALVVADGLTVQGKTLVEHLEAHNHARAVTMVRHLAKTGSSSGLFGEAEVLDIHRLLLQGIDDDNAGRYRRVAVRIAGSTVVLPSPAKVSELMGNFVAAVGTPGWEGHPVERAIEAHYRLVTIHPFTDGNGRVARLLMNLVLLHHGYPAAIIDQAERSQYLASLQQAQMGGSRTDFDQLILRAVDRSLDIYLEAARSGT